MLIGVTAPAKGGKDFVSDYLVDNMPGYVKHSYATPIKIMLAEGLGLTHFQLYGDGKQDNDPRYDKSCRELMQTLGTDWGRNMIGLDIWVNALRHFLTVQKIDDAVIADVRFENEAAFVRERGLLIHITGRGGIPGNHESEAGVEVKDGDIVVKNTVGGSTDGLYRQLREEVINR